MIPAIQLGDHLIQIDDIEVDENDECLLHVDYTILSGDPDTFNTLIIEQFVIDALMKKVEEVLGDVNVNSTPKSK